MHIFTWRKRKKVFHPNGELNWNILLPSSSGAKRSVSSPQLSMHDAPASEPPAYTGPYFLPTKHLRPSFQHLFIPPQNLPGATGNVRDATANNTRVLSTFQCDLNGTKRVKSDWSLNGAIVGEVQPRSASAASVLNYKNHRYKKKNGDTSDTVDYINLPPTSTTTCTPSPENPTEKCYASYDLVHTTLSRAPGEKLGLSLSIQTLPNQDLIDSVSIQCMDQSSCETSSKIFIGDEIISINNSELRSMTRSQCVDLFHNAPLCFNVVIRRAQRTNAQPVVSDAHSYKHVVETGQYRTLPQSSGPNGAEREYDYGTVCKVKKIKRPSNPPPPPPPPALMMHRKDRFSQQYGDGEEIYDDLMDISAQYENIYDLPSGELDPKPHPNYEYPSENLSSGYQSGNNTHTNSDLDLSHCINNDLQARLDFRDNPPTSFGPPNRADIPKSRTSTVVDPYKSPRILGLKVPLNRVPEKPFPAVSAPFQPMPATYHTLSSSSSRPSSVHQVSEQSSTLTCRPSEAIERESIYSDTIAIDKIHGDLVSLALAVDPLITSTGTADNHTVIVHTPRTADAPDPDLHFKRSLRPAALRPTVAPSVDPAATQCITPDVLLKKRKALRPITPQEDLRSIVPESPHLRDDAFVPQVWGPTAPTAKTSPNCCDSDSIFNSTFAKDFILDCEDLPESSVDDLEDDTQSLPSLPIQVKFSSACRPALESTAPETVDEHSTDVNGRTDLRPTIGHHSRKRSAVDEDVSGAKSKVRSILKGLPRNSECSQGAIDSEMLVDLLDPPMMSGYTMSKQGEQVELLSASSTVSNSSPTSTAPAQVATDSRASCTHSDNLNAPVHLLVVDNGARVNAPQEQINYPHNAPVTTTSRPAQQPAVKLQRKRLSCLENRPETSRKSALISRPKHAPNAPLQFNNSGVKLEWSKASISGGNHADCTATIISIPPLNEPSKQSLPSPQAEKPSPSSLRSAEASLSSPPAGPQIPPSTCLGEVNLPERESLRSSGLSPSSLRSDGPLPPRFHLEAPSSSFTRSTAPSPTTHRSNAPLAPSPRSVTLTSLNQDHAAHPTAKGDCGVTSSTLLSRVTTATWHQGYHGLNNLERVVRPASVEQCGKFIEATDLSGSSGNLLRTYSPTFRKLAEYDDEDSITPDVSAPHSVPLTNNQECTDTTLMSLTIQLTPKTNTIQSTYPNGKPIPPPKPEFLSRSNKTADRGLYYQTKELNTNSACQLSQSPSKTINTSVAESAGFLLSNAPTNNSFTCLSPLQGDKEQFYWSTGLVVNAPLVTDNHRSDTLRDNRESSPTLGLHQRTDQFLLAPAYTAKNGTNLHRATYVDEVGDEAMDDLLLDFSNNVSPASAYPLIYPLCPKNQDSASSFRSETLSAENIHESSKTSRPTSHYKLIYPLCPETSDAADFIHGPARTYNETASVDISPDGKMSFRPSSPYKLMYPIGSETSDQRSETTSSDFSSIRSSFDTRKSSYSLDAYDPIHTLCTPTMSTIVSSDCIYRSSPMASSEDGSYEPRKTPHTPLYPLCLEEMRGSTDSGNYVESSTTTSTNENHSMEDSTSIHTGSISISVSSDTSDMEDSASSETHSFPSTEDHTTKLSPKKVVSLRSAQVSDSTIPDPQAHVRDVEVLHMSWDIGMKVHLDSEKRCVISQLTANSPLARLGNVKEGDFLLQINGQFLDGMSELEISTMLRALPRGVVRMSVHSGCPKPGAGIRNLSEKRDSLFSVSTLASEAADPDLFIPSDSSDFRCSPVMSSSSHSQYSYSREVNYGASRQVPTQSTNLIEPISRTEVSRAKSIHVGQPAEFIVKIQKEFSEPDKTETPPRGLAALRQQHTSSFHNDQTIDLTPSVAASPSVPTATAVRNAPLSTATQKASNGFHTQPRSEYARQHSFTDSAQSGASGTADRSNAPTPTKSGVVDPYKIGRDLASDDFKKKREKFLSENGDVSRKSFGSSPVNGASTIADKRSKFSGTPSYSTQTFPKTAFSQTNVRNDQKPKLPSYETTKSPSIEEKSPKYPPLTSSKKDSVTKPAQLTSTAPPVTQPIKSWQRDRTRSSSISSVSSNNSFSSGDPSRNDVTAAISESKTPSGASVPRERSLDHGRVSPAQLSRQLAKRELSHSLSTSNSVSGSGATGGKFSEAMARYKAKTELAGHEGSTVAGERRGGKPLINLPIATNSVLNKANIFEQKASQEGGNGNSPLPPPPVTLGATSRAKSMSSSNLSTGSTFRDLNGHGKVKSVKVLETQPEERVNDDNLWRNGHTTRTQDPTDRRSRDKPQEHQTTHNRASPTSRYVRDSGVSSSNSSEPDAASHGWDKHTSEDYLTEQYSPPPEKPRHTKNNSGVTKDHEAYFPPPPELMEDFPAPPEAFEQAHYPKMPTTAPPIIPIASMAQTVAAIQSAPAKAAEAAAAVRKARSASLERERERERAEKAQNVEHQPSSNGSSEDHQLIEMGRRILGSDGGKENVFLVTLVRPDGSSGGGVGLVLTGGSDYENNPIKVNKVITHSLAHRDGRIEVGDRVLLINGQPCSNMTHRQALDVLKAPGTEVVLVLSRAIALSS